MDIVGSRWWKFDFHNHTPASMDYGKGNIGLKSISPEEWLSAYIEKGIECVAVTDHNSGEWVDRLKEAAADLRAKGEVIHVFPGVEITANGNVHILGIFDPEKNTQFINGVVGAVHYRATYGDSDGVAEDSAEKVVEEIIKCGGVAIPAHIDMPAGLGGVQSAATIAQVCNKSSAIEIVFPQDRPGVDNSALHRYRNLNLELPEIVGSDAHTPTAVGRSFTWVKMSEPSIVGLRLALLDGNSSIRRSDTFEGDPNRASESQLIEVKVKDAKYCGRGKEFVVRFNPWLNSIIGGRGSGKSSLLEFIRIATGRSKDLLDLPVGNEVRDSFTRFARKSLSRDDYGVLLDTTAIEMLYKKQNTLYKLEWRNGEEIKIFRDDELVGWVGEVGDPISRFPVKIFSQRQIFDIAKNPNSLLRLIDESSEVDQLAWRMQWEEEENLFLRLNQEKRELLAKVSHKDTLTGQLADVDQKIQAIESSGHRNILTKYQRTGDDQRLVNGKVEDFQSHLSDMYLAVESYNFSSIASGELKTPSPANVEAVQKINELAEVMQAAKRNVMNLIHEARSKVGQLQEWLQSSKFASDNETVVREYQALVEELDRKGVQNPAIYEQLVSQRAALRKSLEALIVVEGKVNELHSAALQSYERLKGLRKNLSRRRLEFINKYVKSSASIELVLDPFVDENRIDQDFRKVISKLDSTFVGELYDPEKGSGCLYDLHAVLQGVGRDELDFDSLLENRLAKLHEFKSAFVNLPKKGKIYSATPGKRFLDFVAGLPREVMNNVVSWFPEDKLIVKYYDGKRFKDIAQGSAGQKAATVLSFLLSYGDEPLVLDQPEDDLDNGLITSLIVSKLQDNKSERQLVVVTHNPNIVVNGDSEYVIALQDRGQIEVTASGGLQDMHVRKNVCEIMEGGEIALQQRYRRMVNLGGN
ncbi:TrlF family AAA-like ATPase [Pseudomonas sp. NBRC 111119]|uniref:TrlF family AAA-like ATPase n=1 Tax=Pseudomonas sp. NBRC 111119 TaxID=1661034 RepID=UPI0009E7C8FA|nr:PHP-associated domain-containing protein [Pseudomonas sp. NBRC 111119]